MEDRKTPGPSQDFLFIGAVNNPDHTESNDTVNGE